VHEVDRLQWTQHHLEIDYLTCVVPLDNINPVYDDTVDLGSKLKNRIVLTHDFPNVLKRIVSQ